jgi:serine/threonine-protein kinase
MPLHDIRKAKLQILGRMKEVREKLLQSGKIGYAPAHYALGRGFMTLQDYEAAKIHLQEAWNRGYNRPEVAYALGVTC